MNSNNPSKLLFDNCGISLGLLSTTPLAGFTHRRVGLAGAARVLAGLAIGTCALIAQAQDDSQARRLE
jgi:hypothetical protein